MTTFTNLTKAFLKDRATQTRNTMFYIENGYFPTWAQEHHTDADRGLKAHSTARRWEQYTNGEISRDKAIEYAKKRATRELEKDTAEGLAKIERVQNAPELTYATVNIVWKRSSVWGYNPQVETWSDNRRSYGTASGCGYDKRSAGVAEAFNADDTMLRVLYELKEKGLAEGKTSDSETACTGHDNRKIIGYGAGYSVLPYYEGGVGVECFWSILEKAGYKVQSYYGKVEENFRIEKATETATA